MGKKILLADDSITIQKVIELTFSDEDFEVVTVGNGRLAVERIQEVRPDIVLCDIIMPEKDGYEVCEFIKKNPALSHVPVLLLTGAFEPFDQDRATRAGADGSLAKPFEPETLIAKVKELLRKAPPSSSATLSPRPAMPAAAPPPDMTPAPSSIHARPPHAAQTMQFPGYTTQPTRLPLPQPPPRPSSPPSPPAVATFEPTPSAFFGEPVLTPEPEVSFIPEEPFGVLDADSFSAPSAPGTPPGPPTAEAYPSGEDTIAPDLLEVTAEESASLSAPPPDDSASTVMFKAGTKSWSQPTAEVSLDSRVRAGLEPAPAVEELEEVFEEEAVDVSPATMRNVVATEASPAAHPEAAGASAAGDFSFMATKPEAPPPAAARPTPMAAPSAPPWMVETPPFVATAPPPPRAPQPVPAAAAAAAAEKSSFADVAVNEPERAPAAASVAAEVAVPVDMVEKIAQRVVAQISEKVIQQIAWEVIPDLAEAMIKKEIERLKAELQQI